MERERRTVSLTVITLLMYGVVSMLGKGPFAFFPVNEPVFFLVAVYFAIFNFRSARLSYVLMLAIALLGLANNQLVLGLWMDNEKMEAYFRHPSLHYASLASGLLMLLEITRFYFLTRWKVFAFSFPFAVTSIVAGMLFGSLLFVTLGLMIFTGALYYGYERKYEGIAIYSKSLFYLWYLLAFLKLTTLLTMSLYSVKLF